ncbi:MAG: 3alpha(or 20beta)-hydroxysteroid dehydrogenase [Actinomycetota bacterium]|jgi:3alpha(or 20beta)-hydroxysteroid dehydrogenase
MQRLEGKVALVSGGARGMGAAEARLFVSEGARVVIGDVLVDEGKALVGELGDAARFVELDVTDEASWQAAVTAATTEFGRLDVLVNNAGIWKIMPIAMMSVDDFMDVVKVNQLGVFLGMKSAIPAMSVNGGSMVNISSVAGLTGAIGQVAYGGSKWAVRGMTKTAAIELADLGIRVNSIHPGLIDTQMLQTVRDWGVEAEALLSGVPQHRFGTAEEVAKLALFLASDDSSHCTGGEFTVDGGMTAGFAPRN